MGPNSERHMQTSRNQSSYPQSLDRRSSEEALYRAEIARRQAADKLGKASEKSNKATAKIMVAYSRNSAARAKGTGSPALREPERKNGRSKLQKGFSAPALMGAKGAHGKLTKATAGFQEANDVYQAKYA